MPWIKLPSASHTRSDYNLGFFQAKWFEQPVFGSTTLVCIWINISDAILAWTKLPPASSTKSDYNLGFFQAQWFEQPLFGSSALINIWTKI